MERKRPKATGRRGQVPALRAFGGKVREFRHERGLSLEKFAHEADLHWTYVAGVERGERNISLINIHKLARALRVPASRLFE